MKFFQAFTFSQSYLNEFYAKRPTQNLPSSTLRSELLYDGFSAIHYFSEDLAPLGYEPFLTIVNDKRLQEAWMRENAPHLACTNQKFGQTGAYPRCMSDAEIAIFIEQIDAFDPDVLYLDDPISFDSRFIRMLARRPRLVVGWRAASIHRDTDWREFDVIVSNHTPSLELARKHGAKWQEPFMPGFPKCIADRIPDTRPKFDVAFTGSLSIEHRRRVKILKELGRNHQTVSTGYSLSYFAETNDKLPADISRYVQGPIWGMEMYQRLSETKINLNIHIDLAGRQAANMRLFETTGVGAFLLTDDKPNLRELFEPGHEIETFKTTNEMVEKIRYYLNHESERQAIAKRGQKKCLECFSREKAATHLDGIIRHALRAKSTRASPWRRCLDSISMPGISRPVPRIP
jgi:spore maturation protein CgeB